MKKFFWKIIRYMTITDMVNSGEYTKEEATKAVDDVGENWANDMKEIYNEFKKDSKDLIQYIKNKNKEGLDEKAQSQSQRGLIFARRNKYKSKAKTPDKWKWIWNEDWENKGKLPKKKNETIQNVVMENIQAKTVNEGSVGYEETRYGQEYQMWVIKELQDGYNLTFDEADSLIDKYYEYIGECIIDDRNVEDCAESIIAFEQQESDKMNEDFPGLFVGQDQGNLNVNIDKMSPEDFEILDKWNNAGRVAIKDGEEGNNIVVFDLDDDGVFDLLEPYISYENLDPHVK